MVNIPNTPVIYFTHNNFPIKLVGLRENDLLEVTQPAFMPKWGQELTVFWFQHINHYIELPENNDMQYYYFVHF